MMQLIVLGYAFGGKIKGVNIALVDQDRASESRLVRERLNAIAEGPKTFSVLETYKGELSICVKVGKPMQPIFLQDSRFYRTPYVGQHGSVSLRANTKLDWKEIAGLLEGSYELVNTTKKRRR